MTAPSPDVDEPLLDAAGVAERLNVSVPQVYLLARTRELESVRMGRRIVRFRPSAVAAYIDEKTVPAR